ncbi:exo-alpha-sialidase [Sinorhizobium meliloti]|uniref:sialidase family protein n=1 Tax=Rhizobium meliloti TaxID=382 RepID=UPI000FDC6CA3|nr:sialidase family protein [Sinorhizobium meliloti]RVK73162.1 exo-alpha-sialidase [Sinorhizobium meliloti]
MSTEFNDSQHYGFFMTGMKLTSETGKYLRQSELTLAALRAAGFLDNMIDGTSPPSDLSQLWLDKNTDPAVLKEWNPIGAVWEQVTSQTLFGRVPWRGGWDSSAIYRRADVVSYGGRIWIAVQTSQNHPPAEDAYWDLFLESAADDSVGTSALQDGAVTRSKLSGAVQATLPQLSAETMLVDNADGSAREAKPFDAVRQLLGLGDFAHSVVDFIPNYDPSASATRVIIDGSTENGGSPVYHRHFGTIETDNIGRLHVLYRRALGHATYFEGGIYGVYLEHNGQQRSAERQIVAPVAGYDVSDPRLLKLPNGDLLLVWQELHLASPGLADQAVFKGKVSKDNGETWSAAWTIFTSGDGYCRLFGPLKLIQDYGAGGRWRIAMTVYLRVFSPSTTLHTAVFYSDDGGQTFAEGTPVYSGSLQYNETAVAWANASAALAIMRVTPSDGFYISKTTNGGATWSAPVKMVAIETAAVAPSLDVITKNGVQYFLLGYCDRTDNVTKWRWETATKALSTPASAFSGNAKITSAADMIEASGYQAVKVFPAGQMLFVEFKEYAYNTAISDPVGTDVRLVYANPLSWLGGEEAFTPTIVGATTPGTPTGTFTGTIEKDATGLVHWTARIALTSKGGMAGQLKIGGFPYPNRAGTRFRSGARVNFMSGVTLPNYGQPFAFMAASASTVDLWRSNAVGTDTTGIANFDASQIADNGVMELSGHYWTDV